jgi:APA family basic amino acid/polyamine antiporter
MSGAPRLAKNVGLVGVVTFGAGTAIGVSIFSVLQPAAQLAGTGLLVGIGIAGLPMILFAIAYSYLGSALPVSGASYEWPRTFLHPLVGFAIAWLRIVANVGASVVLSLVLVKYASMVVELPLKATMAATITLVFGLNYLGVKIAAGAQTLMMGLLLLLLFAFVATGVADVDPARFATLFDHGWAGILAAVPLLTSLFLGIEAAADIGEEVRDAKRNLPLGIGIAIVLTAVVYGAVAWVALGVAGPEALAASDTPLLDAARVAFGAWAVPVIVGAATVSILKSMNAAALVFTRALFAMGRSGVLPAAFSSIHPRFGTPHVAVAFGWAAAMTGLLLPSSVMFLLLAVNIPTMLKYLACSLCASRVAQSHPEIHARSQLAWRPVVIRTVGYTGAACALLIAALGFDADWRPYALVGGWLAIGLVYYAWRRPADGVREASAG